jgi:predicted ATP-grasp superfamily ATP-dependent carboligase
MPNHRSFDNGSTTPDNHPTHRDPYRVLLTDADYKHSIALARYIKRDMQAVSLIGHSYGGTRYAKHYQYFNDFITNETLQETLQKHEFNQVIPVGAKSVLQVAQTCPTAAVVSSPDRLLACFDKKLTIELASRVGIPFPRTQALTAVEQLVEEDLSFPCVVKPAHEVVSAKSVSYCADARQVRESVTNMLRELRQDGVGVLVQEFIEGPGHGFFALMHQGKPLRIFMHKRIREYPPTGGPSTAAMAYYSSRLEELGLKLLSSLDWNGVAMVEFKFDIHRQDFYLIEINGKFWGSLELALRSGINFGRDLILLYRGEPLEYSSAYDREAKFYWPLDGDLKTLWRTRKTLTGIRDYFRSDVSTNLGQSAIAELLKSVRLIRDLAGGNDS